MSRVDADGGEGARRRTGEATSMSAAVAVRAWMMSKFWCVFAAQVAR